MGHEPITAGTRVTTHQHGFRLASVRAVLAGFAAIAIPSVLTDTVLHATGVFPPAGEPMSDGRWLLATAYRAVYGVVGCYLAARLAPFRPALHVWTLAAIGVAVGTAAGLATRGMGAGFGPDWFVLAVAVLPVPAAMAGLALVRQRQPAGRS